MPENPQNQAHIVYLSHGGGPLPLLGDPGHTAMVDFMHKLPKRLHKPDAILVISAHWEESIATLLSAPRPPLLHDYSGFPAEAYNIDYLLPGNPELVKRVVALLEQASIPTCLDDQRGFDHGVFIPLKLMYPIAGIPCMQLSLLRGLDPAAHLAIGIALHPLLRENILVIGSGFSFHNMRAFQSDGSPAPDPGNDAFQDWLIETCTAPLSEEESHQRLLEWEKAPAARYCHPREEHLLPLHVCQGMAGVPGELIFDDYILGKRGVAFRW